MSASDLESSFIIVDDSQHGEQGALTQSQSASISARNQPTYHPSNDATYVPGSSSSSYAHDWSERGTGGRIFIQGRHFIDAYGRVCNLRGVNLSGACKAPVNHNDESFPSGHKNVTFVGRPFPLEEADEHFSRLRRWGLTFIRFLVTWEAIEHAGPGIYDMEYLDYVRTLLSLLPRYGMTAFVSLHQDVWSRYSGGSGAPAWTLEAVGFDLHSLEKSGAAWLKGVKGGGHVEEERGIWPCGYQKLAASTMATCFWAGDTFCPKLLVKDQTGKDVPVQQFLQNAFLNAWEALAKAIGDLEAVIGFEIMNEPHRGYIELPSLHEFDYNTDLHLSFVPSALQSFLLGAGHPTYVTEWVRSFPMPTRAGPQSLLNTEGHVAWRKDGPTDGKCLWESHGVWGWDLNKKAGVVLRESYFAKHPMTGAKVDWYTDFYYPFLKKWSALIKRVTNEDCIIFVEPIPNEFCPTSWTPEHQLPNMVYAPHWYDLNALFAKAFGNFTCNVQGLSRGMFPLKAFYWGQEGARDNYALQIANIVKASYATLGEKPVLIGECGVPMDMNKKDAFSTGDFTWQSRMMDAMIVALERAMISFTLWNYNPYNTDEKGDDWNGENFSWFSRARAFSSSSQGQILHHEQTSVALDRGARILSSVVRPYLAKTAGIPMLFEYEATKGACLFAWLEPPASGTSQTNPNLTRSAEMSWVPSLIPPLNSHPIITTRETEIFMPSQLTLGRRLSVKGLEDGDRYVHDEGRQTIFIVTRPPQSGAEAYKPRLLAIHISVSPEPEAEFVINSLWGDIWDRILRPLMMVLAAIIAYWVSRWIG